MKKNPKNKYITRTEWSFWVRFHTGNNNPKGAWSQRGYICQAQKSFAFQKYGGIRKALAAAREWRDKTEAKLRPEPKKKIALWIRHSKNTVFRGVWHGRRKRVRESGAVTLECYYQVSWSEYNPDGPNWRMNKKFSYKDGDEIGQRNAERLAIRHRKRMERLHYFIPKGRLNDIR